jgi:hypothetical protein
MILPIMIVIKEIEKGFELSNLLLERTVDTVYITDENKAKIMPNIKSTIKFYANKSFKSSTLLLFVCNFLVLNIVCDLNGGYFLCKELESCKLA